MNIQPIYNNVLVIAGSYNQAKYWMTSYGISQWKYCCDRTITILFGQRYKKYMRVGTWMCGENDNIFKELYLRGFVELPILNSMKGGYETNNIE